MNNKYTFAQLCDLYDKIEIPIIQRDYAQGRNNQEVKKIRDKFINDFLLDNILQDNQVELDFVYGSILTETKDEVKQKIFIPLDGQQRLTTLFLLYFYTAVNENRIEDVSNLLLKFTYETRPTAHDFCELLITNGGEFKNTANLRFEIEDSVWFNEEWKNDPTIAGMLKVLETFQENKQLNNSTKSLLDKLLDTQHQFISFYFTDLEEFGLTENLYIRMNARGKMLTDFENFKSEFYKIIQYEPALLDQVKDKIEYKWVENLWEYRDNDSYVIDNPFMHYLSFITEMLYYKDAQFRASPSSYETNFLDFKVLKSIYSIEDNLKFLIFSLDFIKEINQFDDKVLWDGKSIHNILNDIVQGKTDTNQYFILYSALKYSFSEKPLENLLDYIRVVRNLIQNTEDNSRREWSRLLGSLQNLISDENVYKVLSVLKDENKLLGFRKEQREEEVFKSHIILQFSDYKKIIFQIEDNNNFKGNIANILKVVVSNTEEEFNLLGLNSVAYNEELLKKLKAIFVAYEKLSTKDFNPIWGNLLITGLYSQTYESRLLYSFNFEKHPAILLFAKEYSQSKLSLSEYIIKIQKEFIHQKEKQFDDFSEIRNVKEQLYLYYIINERIYEKDYTEFFKNNNFNFGWLRKETGYKSFFIKGIKGCQYFPNSNPIFQVYNYQFRYNLGINSNNTLDIEIVGGNKKRNPFELIKIWAKK
ncbi:MAG: DUF262 domain-containing protein [Chitinophagales bacterium]|nr:DUF262 domain-containing protein [Chitinophagales bacterium]